MQGIAGLQDRPRPHQSHHEVAEGKARHQHVEDMGEAMRRLARALRANLGDQQRQEAGHGIDQRKAAEDAAADRKAGADADDQDGARRGRGIFLRQPHQAEHQHDHRHRKRRVFWIHEHVAVEGRAQCEQQERRESRKRSADAARQPPRYRKADKADDGAKQAARLEQFERNDLVQQRRRHVEAAAIHVEIGERQRGLILEAAAIHPQQQVGIFGVRVVVPAEAVIAERKSRDDGDDAQHK